MPQYSDDPADLFIQLYDELDEGLIRSGEADAWFGSEQLEEIAGLVEDQVTRNGRLEPERVEEALDLAADRDERLFAYLLGLDRALMYAHPAIDVEDRGGLYEIAVRYRRTGRFDTGRETGALIPRQAVPTRLQLADERTGTESKADQFASVVRASAEAWQATEHVVIPPHTRSARNGRAHWYSRRLRGRLVDAHGVRLDPLGAGRSTALPNRSTCRPGLDGADRSHPPAPGRAGRSCRRHAGADTDRRDPARLAAGRPIPAAARRQPAYLDTRGDGPSRWGRPSPEPLRAPESADGAGPRDSRQVPPLPPDRCTARRVGPRRSLGHGALERGHRAGPFSDDHRELLGPLRRPHLRRPRPGRRAWSADARQRRLTRPRAGVLEADPGALLGARRRESVGAVGRHAGGRREQPRRRDGGGSRVAGRMCIAHGPNGWEFERASEPDEVKLVRITSDVGVRAVGRGRVAQ